jgi:hypothetical protein
MAIVHLPEGDTLKSALSESKVVIALKLEKEARGGVTCDMDDFSSVP